MIKVWDYIKEYNELREDILNAVDLVFKNGTLVFGPRVEEFEGEFAKYCDSQFGIGVGNCTDALYLALKVFNIGKDDEVITVSNTAVPTCTAIAMTGARPVFVDIDEYSLIDVSKIEKAITPQTKAIIPVHLFGQTCDMDVINRIAKQYNLKVIEDCAQSHGALYKGKKAGSLGDIGCFSFYPTKIFGAYGDGGFITTNSEELYDKMNRMRFFGMERKKMSSGHWNGKYYAIEEGPITCNTRLDEVHASILLVKLKELDKWINRRREIANKYKKELSGLSLILPQESPHNRHAYYIYVVSHPNRDKIMAELVKKDIHLNISYPWPVHTMKGYKYLGWKEGDLPITENNANNIFSLPMYPTLTDEEQDIVINTLKEILKKESPIPFLNLGKQPITNNFLKNDKVKDEYFYNLTVQFDPISKLVSLQEMVDPSKMFNDNYAHRASSSSTMRNHFKNLSTQLQEDKPDAQILEIGSNDGAFLKYWETKRSIAVEPCGNFAKETQSLGYTTYNEFWTTELSQKIKEKHGKQDIIYAANCICHIPTLDDTFQAVELLLKNDGVFIFEDPSLYNIIKNTSYDQIYDEHPNIFSIIALDNLLQRNGLYIVKVENLSVHGGSNRVFVMKGHRNIHPSVILNKEKERELGIDKLETLQLFAKRVEKSRELLLKILNDLKNKGKKIISYGATYKSTTIFNYCKIDSKLIDYVVDTTLDKQGKLTPGMHIPIISPEEGFDDSVDYAFLGAWNFKDEISKKESKFLDRGGKFITHVPTVKIIETKIKKYD